MVFISEDLTPDKSKLAFMAREAVQSKDTECIKRWTFMEKTFIVRREGMGPEKIEKEDLIEQQA